MVVEGPHIEGLIRRKTDFQDPLGDLHSNRETTIVLDAILNRGSAVEHTTIVGAQPALESSLGAPSIPDSPKNCSTPARWNYFGKLK